MNYLIEYSNGRTQSVEADEYGRDQEFGWIAFRKGIVDVLMVDPAAVESIRQDGVDGPELPVAKGNGGRANSRR